MASNKVVINSVSVDCPPGMTCANWMLDGEPRLRNTKRRVPLDLLVIHETAGNSASGCKRTLANKKLGIHFILDKSGHMSQHADPTLDVCWHANQCNRRSIGIEVVNAYRPEVARDRCGEVVPAEWWTWVPAGAPHTYLTPTVEQLAAVRVWVPWLCEQLGIPFAFPTANLGPKQPRIPGWRSKPAAQPGPGIVAHRDFASHADGRYLLEMLIREAND